MSKITKWRAIRSGALITLSGVGPDGRPIRLTKVEAIESQDEGGAVAIRGDDRFVLA